MGVGHYAQLAQIKNIKQYKVQLYYSVVNCINLASAPDSG